ncbi:hypothetical protein ACU8KH_02726 [Lachancea thermotolerans]
MPTLSWHLNYLELRQRLRLSGKSGFKVGINAFAIGPSLLSELQLTMRAF